MLNMLNRNLTIVDVETTGGSPVFHHIIEIGILRIEHGEVVAKFKSFVNPHSEIPEFISKMTGITQKQVDRAPEFADIAEEIFPQFEDSTFVAHNAGFDYGFLRSEFGRLGWGLVMPQLCTVRLSRALYPRYKRHNLTALIERFDFSCKNRHRAFDDAKVLWDFLQLVNKDFEPAVALAAVERTIRKVPPSVQQKLPKTLKPTISYHPLES